MGSSCIGKRKPAPEVIYLDTIKVKNIIANVNNSHPYVTAFLQSYPYSVDYQCYTNGSFSWIEHKQTNFTFDAHINSSVHPLWELSMTKGQYARLTAIQNFKFSTLPQIKISMTVGDLRDICSVANQSALKHIFKYSPDRSEWTCVPPIPTINMHIDMISVSDKTLLTLSIHQAKELANFLKQPFIE